MVGFAIILWCRASVTLVILVRCGAKQSFPIMHFCPRLVGQSTSFMHLHACFCWWWTDLRHIGVISWLFFCCCARLFAAHHVVSYFLCALRLLSKLMKHMLRNVFEKERVLTFNILWKIKSKPIATKGWPNTVHTQGPSIFFVLWSFCT
jgi:hypothetical protein